MPLQLHARPSVAVEIYKEATAHQECGREFQREAFTTLRPVGIAKSL